MMIGEKSAPMWQLGLGGHPSGGEGVFSICLHR
jgi:hypothetical protein